MDIAHWLERLGLARYASAFADNAIDVAMLAGLTAEDLKEIGVGPLGHRKRLLEAIAALGSLTEPGPAEAPAQPSTRAREAERRQLTVMFVDLVGSTALSARLDPEEMREVLKAYQNAVVGEISRVDGFTAKLMGDGVLAYFGWPRAHEDEPERAVRAGLAIVRAVAGLPASMSLACRVGIATGLVVVGDLVGDGASQEEAVVGDTPNLAARLQALAAPGEVVVAEATRRLLGSGFAVESLGVHTVKGLAEPVPAFRVTGERAVESRFAGRAGETVAPMEGRDEELALLTRQWRESLAGEGRAVMVVGEAGIGKSRLIRALREAVQPDRPTVLLYQCSPFHADSPFWPVTQQLAFAAGLEPGDEAAAKRQKLGLIVSTTERLDLLASLLGIAADPDRLAGLDPQERRRRTLQALVDELTRLASQGPVLVLMEDVHWVDPSTIELLRRTLEAITSRPVLVVLTSRPEAEPRLGTFPHLSRLVLSRLGRAAVEAIVGRLLEARAMDAGVRAQILARTDGVPLFVEELTKAVLEQAPAGLGVTVPSTLQDSLLARLDRDPLMKSVAQIAACIGREFDHALLVSVAEMLVTELGRGLESLVESELVYRRGSGADARYSFKHALVRDAAYESLLKSRRRAIHGRMVTVLEGLSGTAPEILAHHTAEAGQTEQAVRYWLAAGKVAAERSANVEAVVHLKQGLNLLGILPYSTECDRLEFDFHLTLGNCLMLVRGWAAHETAAAFARAAEICENMGGNSQKIAVLLGQYIVQLCGANLSEAQTTANYLLALGQHMGDTPGTLLGHRAMGCSLLYLGQLASSLEHWECVVNLYDPRLHASLARTFAYDTLVHCEAHMARCLLYMGFPERARSRLESALKWAGSMRHAGTLGLALYEALLFAAESRDLRQARDLASRCQVFAGEHGYEAWRSGGVAIAAWSGDHSTTDDCVVFERAMATHERGGNLARPLFLGLLAKLLIRADRPRDALDIVDEGLETIKRTGERLFEPELLCLRGAALAASSGNDTDQQEWSYQRAITVAKEMDAKLIELRASTSLARLWAEQGDRQRALDLLAPIYGWFTEGFDAPDLVEAKTMLDALT